VVRIKNEKVLNEIHTVMLEIGLIINELASTSLLGEGDRRG
jgi:very-short-patch-repair endonuclease